MFNFGHSFYEAGRKLQSVDSQRNSTHPDSPVEFLYWHAIELFLKAFLLADGISVEALRRQPYGHNVESLSQK